MSAQSKPASDFSEAQLTASAETAPTALAEAGSRGEALVKAWIANANAAAIQEIAEHGQGAVRKAARRGLNVLKARQVVIPPRRRKQASSESRAEPEAWIMAPDSSGAMLVVIAQRQASAAYRASFVFLEDGVGVLKVDTGEMSHSRLHDGMASALRGQAYSPVSVPVAWARSLIDAARRAQREAGNIEPLGYRAAGELLSPIPEQPPIHPFDEEGLELATEDAKQLASNSAALHELAEFRSWLPSNQALNDLLTKVGERLPPGEKPADDELTTILKEEALAATDRYFTPEERERLIRRMKHSALSVLAREGEQRALELAAVIQVISQAGLVTDPPRDIPFLSAFFDKAIGMMIAQSGGRLRIPVPRPGLADDSLLDDSAGA